MEFTLADAADLHKTALENEYDLITTFDAVHDQSLKPDGVYLMQDISGTSHIHKDLDYPIGTFLYTLSCMHCMSVSLAPGGEGLGAMWREDKTREYLHKAGFNEIRTHRLEHDFQNNWYVVRSESGWLYYTIPLEILNYELQVVGERIPVQWKKLGSKILLRWNAYKRILSGGR